MNEVIKDKEYMLRRSKRLLVLFLLLGITVVSLVLGTYAWFIGIDSVNINDFNVHIVSTETLEISLDGYSWSSEVNVTENNIKSHTNGGLAYEDNTNHWVGEDGLVPVSSSGDNTAGKLDIYAKSSLTGTDGGFRMTSNKLDNSEEEFPYYVTFDIFVKNRSGDTYNPSYNLLDDESIFLIKDSTILGTASGETSYGIQNSARVAFVQLGRINMDDLVAYTTPVISCDTPASGETYTPLCNKLNNVYKTVIWEPNELDHADELLDYYETVCHEKTDYDTYTTNACEDITSGYVPTYTMKKNIVALDYVDIYDGLNDYSDNIQTPSSVTTRALQNTKTFTDTMKETEGNYSVFKLAPHSVTKIRVYVYLEGQDVDNYDLVTNDVDISVTFGFTKERKNTDVLLDVENPTLDFVVRSFSASGQPYIPKQSIVLDGSNETITWEEWVTDTQTYTDAVSTCNDYICIANEANHVLIRNVPDSLSPYVKITENNYTSSVSKTDSIVNNGGYNIQPMPH